MIPIAFVQKLKAVGFTEEQAAVFSEAQKAALTEAIEGRELATLRDLREMELRLSAEIAKSAAATKGEIVKWVAGMLIAQAAVVAALVKLL